MKGVLLIATAALAIGGCSSSSSTSSSPPPPPATDGGSSEAAPTPDRTYIDDAGVEHHADGGLTNNGCLTLGGLVGQAKQDAKSCANVPGVCQATIKDECGCPVYVEEPTNDYAKRFAELAAELYAASCSSNKCGQCPDTSDGGLCEPQAMGPLQCTP
jgi:hypothetical protein